MVIMWLGRGATSCYNDNYAAICICGSDQHVIHSKLTQLYANYILIIKKLIKEWTEIALFSPKVSNFLPAEFLHSYIQFMFVTHGRVCWSVSYQKDSLTFGLSCVLTESRDLGKLFLYVFRKIAPSPYRFT